MHNSHLAGLGMGATFNVDKRGSMLHWTERRHVRRGIFSTRADDRHMLIRWNCKYLGHG